MMTSPDFLCSDGACLPGKGDVRVGKGETGPRTFTGCLGLFGAVLCTHSDREPPFSSER